MSTNRRIDSSEKFVYGSENFKENEEEREWTDILYEILY